MSLAPFLQCLKPSCAGLTQMVALENQMTESNTTRRTVKTVLTLAVMGVGLALSSGCAQVAPYERAKLAHPTMAASDVAGAGEEHLRAITEGAIGGSSGAGSGCGCN